MTVVHKRNAPHVRSLAAAIANTCGTAAGVSNVLDPPQQKAEVIVLVKSTRKYVPTLLYF